MLAATAETIERTTPLNGTPRDRDRPVKLPDSPHTRRWLEATRNYAAALEEQSATAQERVTAVQREARDLADASEALHGLLDRLGVQKGAAPALPTATRKLGPRRTSGEWAITRAGEVLAACKHCGRSDRKHKAHGYCMTCYDTYGKPKP